VACPEISNTRCFKCGELGHLGASCIADACPPSSPITPTSVHGQSFAASASDAGVGLRKRRRSRGGRRRGRGGGGSSSNNGEPTGDSAYEVCKFCHQVGHIAKGDSCPSLRRHVCRACGERGHTQRYCRNGRGPGATGRATPFRPEDVRDLMAMLAQWRAANHGHYQQHTSPGYYAAHGSYGPGGDYLNHYQHPPQQQWYDSRGGNAEGQCTNPPGGNISGWYSGNAGGGGSEWQGNDWGCDAGAGAGAGAGASAGAGGAATTRDGGASVGEEHKHGRRSSRWGDRRDDSRRHDHRSAPQYDDV
jgi:hypothetical protein